MEIGIVIDRDLSTVCFGESSRIESSLELFGSVMKEVSYMPDIKPILLWFGESADGRYSIDWSSKIGLVSFASADRHYSQNSPNKKPPSAYQ